MDPRTDLELVDAANRGDAGAVDALYLRYRDWVVALAFRTCRHREDSHEVLQETFLYLCRKLPGLTLRSRMKTFLYPVVRHLAIDATRRRGRSSPLEVDPPHEPRDPGREQRELEDVVAGLPEAQREVVLLRFGDGLSLAEIAGALEVPLGTVKSRLHHALARLRESMGDEKPRNG